MSWAWAGAVGPGCQDLLSHLLAGLCPVTQLTTLNVALAGK